MWNPWTARSTPPGSWAPSAPHPRETCDDAALEVLLLVAWSWRWEIDLRSLVWLAALVWGCVSTIALARFLGRYIAYRWG
ncbi:hypothetical protein GCM10009642_57990 [Nocardiopsis metallicus]